ncbi:tRNA pseudouridine synthase B [Candidatus Nitrosoglobus terrae]|uniref:tRNA pseudouridine synthase B n=1 Tax=Candidatus Nitrosoglobus terrae TaxID=1630141 RepID=A0A1Q2SNF6_9GAMM|nr:tRNA pseudouridine(55) synthase TruB [Candidatus Nitrosoglobus terrae]BAW80652.1 tRNA pseudouridine synthase B [Candidatus Nitrosoglobus terrae]
MKQCQPKGQNIHGVILLDKPAGISSNSALQQVKQIYQACKAGHTGSLDPIATGLLPICFGEATKISGFLLEADKRYQVTCRLGITTTTGDVSGEVVKVSAIKALKADEIVKTLASFSGSQKQIPPMYSALKYQGRRLYELARQGIEIEREPRQVIIYNIKFIDLMNDKLEFEVFCSKGTYIRVLVEDIGWALGCGAHVTALRRTQSGCFDSSEMVSLKRLKELAKAGIEQLNTLLLPLERALGDWPAIDLIADLAHYLRQGRPVRVSQTPDKGWVRLIERDKGFFGIGQVTEDGRIAPRRLIFT